ncbi:MAG: hypothetical protein ABSD44_15385 [Terracidiphilus sp.]
MTGQTTYIPSALLVYLCIFTILNISKSSKAKRLAGSIIFDGTFITKAMLIVSTAGFTLGTIYVFVKAKDDIMGMVIFSSLAVAGSAGFPSTISITRNGISEHQWWGRTIYIDWREIQKIEYHKGPQSTVLYGCGGKKITHSGFHRDPHVFQKECLRRTQLKLVTSNF